MNNLKEDLSALSSVPQPKIVSLIRLTNYCITQDFLESILEEKDHSEYDIGIGKLIIGERNGELKYKFVPSDALKEALYNTKNKKLNLLSEQVEKNLVEIIENTYKSLL